MARRSGNLFRNGVSLQNLQEGTELNMVSDNEDFSSDEDYFSEDSFQNFKEELKRICRGDEDDADLDVSSFEVISKKMVPLTDDGLVKKVELKPGIGPVIPPKSLVLIHYNAYLEKQTTPFDSTYQRNSPFRFLLGDQRLVYGLDLAIATMKKGEVSAFLIHHDYAYGSMGCPPRVPPSATVYYEVEVLNYVESGDAIEFEHMTPEEQKRAPFDKILSACKAEYEMGNNLFGKKMFAGAVSRYRKATYMLEDVCVADEADDNKRQSMLLKLYMNMSVCYLKLKNAKKSRINAQNVLKLDQNRTKALYLLGKSYCLDAEYDEALKCLHRAQRNDQYNEEINKEISKIQNLRKQYDEKHRKFCENIFGGKKSTNSHFSEPKEFVDSIKDCVKCFKESSEKEYCFPSGFTPAQLDDIKTVASLNGVQFIEKIHDGNKICKLCKKVGNA